MDEPGEGPLEDLVVPGSVGRRVGEFSLGVFSALFCLMVYVPPSHQTILPWLFGPLSALVSVHFVLGAFDRRPRLVVTSEGITDRTALFGGTLFIRWSDVLDVTAGRWSGRVSLIVRDSEALRERTGVVRRMWMKLGAMFGLRGIPISVTVIGLKDRLDAGLLEYERRQLGLGADHPRLGERPSQGKSGL